MTVLARLSADWRRAARLAADRRGVTALEFAIIAVPLFMMTLAPIEFGRLLWARQAVQMTAEQAARCVGLHAAACTLGGTYDQTTATNYVISQAQAWGVSLSAGEVSVTNNAASGACTGLSQVAISYTFNTAIPGLLPMLSNVSGLSGFACFPNQN